MIYCLDGDGYGRHLSTRVVISLSCFVAPKVVGLSGGREAVTCDPTHTESIISRFHATIKELVIPGTIALTLCSTSTSGAQPTGVFQCARSCVNTPNVLARSCVVL